MERIRNWLLPVLLAIQQVAYWPGRALRDDDPVGVLQPAAGLAAAVVITAALGVRRGRPVVAALAVEAVLLACLPLPEDATLLHALSPLVALYSVAVRCPGRTAALVGGALALCETGRAAVLLESGVEAGGEAVINCVLFLTVAGLGRTRRRWLAGRRAAARDLARAESERARAALTERERLARDLHDVSAHHLTSVVVTAAAALRLGDRRPELTGQALRFAADTGRETLAALHRLVAMARTAAADEGSALRDRVDELAAGFARLGLRPAVDVAPDLAALTGPVADAAFGIVREALTNALRYAPEATVRVRIRVAEGLGGPDGADGADGAVHLTVEDDGASSSGEGEGSGTRVPAGQRLGSGRGTAGMRERATALGGTLAAGPRDDGPGWSVRARLPRASGALRPTGALRDRAARHPALRGLDLSDGALALAAAALPLVVILAEEPTATVLACGPAAAHALPLLWRRRAPWAVLCAVLATAWLAPLGLALGLLSPAVALCLLVAGGAAECVAVYAVAAFAGPGGRTWPVMAVGAAGLSLSSLALASANGIRDLATDGGFGLLVFLAVVLGAVFLLPMAALWGLGAGVRTRRERVRAWEDHALTATVRSAVAEAHEERRRIAGELRGEVLRHADAVVVRAEAGDLDGVADAARAGLSAMRGLLAVLREAAGPGLVPASCPGPAADVDPGRIAGPVPAPVHTPVHTPVHNPGPTPDPPKKPTPPDSPKEAPPSLPSARPAPAVRTPDPDPDPEPDPEPIMSPQGVRRPG
ncbi:histidine kinase [Streptomyces sp. NPDC058308]|uniref:sensor histidine kinase n=1 Tax=Streptomyces sp. NPDC058308 TaxID=3346440 RepID=UPI0036EC9338